MKERLFIGITVFIGIAVGAGLFYYWQNPQSPLTAVGDDLSPAIETGQTLYANNCLSCHGDQNGRGRLGQTPPHNGDGHTWHHSDTELIYWILEGRTVNMPAFKGIMDRAGAEAVLAYIKTWWTPQQQATQADISRRYQEALDRQNNGN